MNEKDQNGNAVEQNGHFFKQTEYRFPPIFFNCATAVLQNGIQNFFLSSTVHGEN